MKTNIIITFQVEGFHNFPKAAEIFPKVSFLSDRHRHTFWFKCTKLVTHSDRDIEIILFKREVLEYVYKTYLGSENYACEFGPKSCEMLAQELVEKFDLQYCSCLEDNEVGAEVWK